MLVGPELAGASHACLDLVENEEDARLIAELAEAGQVAVVGHDDAALALDGLDEHGGRPAVDGALEGLQVVVGDVLEAGGKRLEAVVVLLLGGRRHRGQRPAVEAAVHADDVAAVASAVLLGPLPGELDGRLVGLRARVREEDPVRERMVAEQGRKLRLLGDMEDVRDVHEGGRLLPQRSHDLGMAMPERGDGDAAREVEVLLAVRVPHAQALASHQCHRLPLGEGHEPRVRELDHPLGIHLASPVRGRSPSRCLPWSGPRGGWREGPGRR